MSDPTGESNAGHRMPAESEKQPGGVASVPTMKTVFLFPVMMPPPLRFPFEADCRGLFVGEANQAPSGRNPPGNDRLRWPALGAALLLLALAAPLVAAPAYPLKPGATGRYLVDQSGTPFLMLGDSPQSLMVNLSEADAATYFANRSALGFNTVWINVLCTTYTGGRADSSTLDGTRPFTANVPSTSSYDLTSPNETYFAHVDRILGLAGQFGLQVMLDPIETGGYLRDTPTLQNNGVARCRAYGQYLGNRYKGVPNLIWVSGNDFDYPTYTAAGDPFVQAVALGIRGSDSNHLQTVELGAQSGSLDDASWAPIIGLDAAYTWSPTYAQVLAEYNRASFLPVFLVEAHYESETMGYPPAAQNTEMGTPLVLRRQEYWTLLSGAAGQLYGDHYLWPFSPGWQSNLNTPGATQIGYVQSLFASRPWYALVPDQGHAVVTAGYGTFAATGLVSANDYLTAARTPDGRLAIAYLPSQRTVTVDLGQFSGPVSARWFDPTNGTFVPIAVTPLPNTGTRNFTPPGNHGDGTSDWVLVIEVLPGAALDNQTFLQRLFLAVLGRAVDPGGLATFESAMAAGSSQSDVLGGLLSSAEYNLREVEPAIRLYYAALARPPDYTGLQNWSNALQAGTLTLMGAADQFAGSAEFLLRYGALDNTGYVQQLYRNVLGREADPAGLADWVGQLNAGASRGQILVGFSESDEFKANLADQVEILRLYFLLLQRVPTAAELQSWTGFLKGDDQTDTLFAQGSPAGLPDADYVQEVFRGFLRRDANAGELSTFGSELTGGTVSNASLVDTLLDSTEFNLIVGPVSRLYLAALRRVPDVAGLDNWVNFVRARNSLQVMADAFAASQEFLNRYSALSNLDYVAQLYRDVLGREADPAGLASWTALLDSGGTTRGQILIGFSESQEAIQLFAPTLRTFLHYFTFLNTAPAQSDLDYWKNYLATLDDQLRATLLADPVFTGIG